MKTANRIVRQAQKWVGKNEADGSFKAIIDLYNSVEPIPRGYRASYNSEWCAITITALGYATGMSDLIGAECSVPKFIEIFKAKKIWLGPNASPKAGDIVIYDWDAVKDGDHIGIVEKVSGDTVTAIEGNMSGTTVNGQYLGKVGRREFKVGWSRVTGYARPKYQRALAVFQLTNPNSGEHFYTVSAPEADTLVRAGWRDDGIGWYSNPTGMPVHRLYKADKGLHAFTSNPGELAQLVADGWKHEGIAFRAGGTRPVYRLYKGEVNLYTISEDERDAAIENGFTVDGIGWHCL